MSAVFIVLVCVGAVLGAVIGYFRKFTQTSFWGVTVLLTLLLDLIIGSGAKKEGYGIALIIATVVILVLLTVIIGILQKMLVKVVEARKEFSHYENYDDLEESEALILDAVDKKDRKEYKKQLKNRKKIKDNAGGWGIADGVLGAVSGSVNALMGLGVVILCLILFFGLSHIGAFESLINGLSQSSWKNLGVKLALDMPLITVLCLSIRAGYKGGISTVLSIVVVIGLLIGFGAASFAIASSAACAGTVEALKNGMLAGIAGTIGDKANVIAQAIIAGIIFLFSLVFVVLAGIFLPKVVEKFRENEIFTKVDGVIGAIVMLVVILMVLIVLGGIANTLSDLDFMSEINNLASNSRLGDALYAFNPMAKAFASFPIRGWFAQ